MLNRVCFWLLFLGITYGFAKGAVNSWRMPDRSAQAESSDEHPPRTLSVVGNDLTNASLDAAKVSVNICLGLIGVMTLWLGLLRVAEDAGLVKLLARMLRPIMRWLFPDVPDGHPAQGAMLMNISANMLGLDNAATPFGVKAMRELQTLNPTDDTATNSMATFLALNTSSVTIIPFTIIGYRVAAHSDKPAGPTLAILLTTTVSTIVAIIVVRWLSRWPRFSMNTNGENGSANTLSSNTGEVN